MSNYQENTPAVGTAMAGTKPSVVYSQIYNDTRSMITEMSGLSEAALNDAATELAVDYEMFLMDYRGSYIVDDYMGLVEMLHEWPSPWPSLDESTLNGLTEAHFFLIWAWHENNVARYFLDGEAVAHGWEPGDAMSVGVMTAVSAAKSLFHAEVTMPSDGDKLEQAWAFPGV